jgi:hypothetical protein
MVPDIGKMIMVIALMAAVAGWVIIQSLIWLFSHIHFTLN